MTDKHEERATLRAQALYDRLRSLDIVDGTGRAQCEAIFAEQFCEVERETRRQCLDRACSCACHDDWEKLREVVRAADKLRDGIREVHRVSLSGCCTCDLIVDYDRTTEGIER